MAEQKRKTDKGKRIVRNIKVRITALILIYCTLSLTVFCGMKTQMSEVQAKTKEPENLYAQSAVLMDADSGRILFSKNGQQERAMASTTKIMTCILALEYGKLDGKMSVSSYAASQPQVRLGAIKGEEFYLRDLLYSLMLESHNDSAVIIAENVGKNVEGFADMMNAKAKELGCENTYFITPNGLDASDEKGSHRTTAEDLAKIMQYCIMKSPKKDMFLEVTRTQDYQFTDCSGKHSYSCVNHNAFLKMMKGALSGKTGFTGDAGYCYIGSLQDKGRTFIVALLACGWPNNKSYKWADTKALMKYGIEHYEYRNIRQDMSCGTLKVYNGIDSQKPFETETEISLEVVKTDENWNILLRDDEEVNISLNKKKSVKAPVEKGEKVGEVHYTLNGEMIKSYDIVTGCSISEKNAAWYLKTIIGMYFLQKI